MENAKWLDIAETGSFCNCDGYFHVFIPLSMILGFAEDYRKIVVNAEHKLILIRSKDECPRYL